MNCHNEGMCKMSEEKMPILELLERCAKNFRRLANKEDVSLGFNAFALVSNTYHRENFHSDILAAILNPLSEHGEGALFLKQFLTFIADVAMGKGKKNLQKPLRLFMLMNKFVLFARRGE